MVVPCSFRHYAGLALQAPSRLDNSHNSRISVSHLKGRDHHLSQRPHDGNHALAFGNINAYTVHVHSSNTKFATGTHLFLAADSIYWVTRTQGSTCLKPNAATRGWLTVSSTGMQVQEKGASASCSSYCSLGTRWKEAQPDAGLPTKLYCNRKGKRK